eukprot:Gb_23096 [translate_table: standard]
MAFWLKAAEDLLQEVDRRAKQVVGELSDQQSEIPTIASEQDVLGRVHSQNSKGKGPKKASLSKPLANANGSEKDGSPGMIRPLESNGNLNRDRLYLPQEKKSEANDSVSQPSDQPEGTILDMELAESSVSETVKPSLLIVSEQNIDKTVDLSSKENSGEIVAPSIKGDPQIKTFDVSAPPVDASSSLAVQVVDHETLKCNLAAENDVVTVELLLEKEPSKETLERDRIVSEHEREESNKKLMEEAVEADVSPKASIQSEQPEETSNLVARVDDQLDEAQGLLKIAVSTGQSKEARLARVCVGLSSRLQEYKSENAQLEELLVAEREEKNAFDARVKQLQREISLARAAASAVEAEMADALASKNTEIEALITSMESLKKQAAVAEGKLATLQANTEAVMRNRELTETRMIQALREELASTEHRAVEERAAHNATRMAAMEREAELEQRAAEASAALARIQRTVDERTQKTTDLEHKVSMLEVECATLNQELQELEARNRREQKRPIEEANQTSQAWREEAERARQAQREAEAKLFTMEAETQKLRVEMSSMKRDAEHYSRQAQVELEKRYRELTDLLYLKQTQLEAMASEKATAIFQLEKEAKRLREVQAEVERNRNLRRTSTPWDEDDSELKPLEPLTSQQRRMVGSSIRKAAKLLDSGAVSAGRFLWRHPLARIILLFYLVFVHIFLLYLLHRLQEQADNSVSSREAAAAMGLVKPDLP